MQATHHLEALVWTSMSVILTPVRMEATVYTDLVNAFSCDCVAGFDGTRCEINVDECHQIDNPEPCLNGGTCIDLVNACDYMWLDLLAQPARLLLMTCDTRV